MLLKPTRPMDHNCPMNAARVVGPQVMGIFIGALLYSAGSDVRVAIVTGLFMSVITSLGRAVTSDPQHGHEIFNSVTNGWVFVFGSSVFLVVLVGGAQPLLVVLIAVAVGALMVSENRHVGAGHPLTKIDFTTVGALAVVVLTGLIVQMWVFMAPLLIAVIVSLSVVHFAGPSRWKIRTLVISSAVSVGSFLSHQFATRADSEGLIFRSADQYWRAALANVSFRFGLGDHPGAVGLPIRYHWISESMMGGLAVIANTDVVQVVLRVSGPLAISLAAFAVYQLARVCDLSKTEGLLSTILLVVTSTYLYSLGINALKTTEMGQLWGTPFFLVGMTQLVRFFRFTTWKSGLNLLWVLPLTIMTNSTLGLVLGATSALACLHLLLLRRAMKIAVVIAFSVFLIFVLLSRTLLNSSFAGNFAPRIGLNDLFGYSYVFGYNGTNQFVKIAGAVAFLLILWFQSGAYVPHHSTSFRQGLDSFWMLYVYAALSAVFLGSITDIGNFEQYRFLIAILVLGPVLAARNLRFLKSEIRQVSKCFVVLTMVLAVGFGWIARDFLQKSFGDAEFMIPRLTFALFLALAPFGLWGFFYGLKQFRPHFRTLSLSSLFLVYCLTAGVVHTSREFFAQYLYASKLESPTIAEAERLQCLVSLRDKSEVSDLFASTMWRWSDEYFSEKWYIATAISERRSYLDGPLYVAEPRPEWLQNRADLTLRFAEDPKIDDLAELKKWGVTWFVADKTWPTTKDWSKVGVVETENEACVLVRLSIN